MSILTTIATVWKVKKIGSKLTGFFSSPKVIVTLIIAALIGYLLWSGHYKNVKITNLTSTLSTVSDQNERYSKQLELKNSLIDKQNLEVQVYKEKSDILIKKIADLNILVSVERLKTQNIVLKYKNAPEECEAAFNWLLDVTRTPELTQ